MPQMSDKKMEQFYPCKENRLRAISDADSFVITASVHRLKF